MMAENKRAVVTGASSGIGQEFAVQLAKQGYSVTLVARREQRLREQVDLLEGSGHSFRSVDLSDVPALEALAAEIEQGRYQLLVNNAGRSILQPFFESDIEEQQSILHTNCTAVVRLAHAFLRQSQAGDALINLASIVAYLPTPAQPIYSASKAFIASFSECLWEEHRERGVYVMGLCPGVTKTEFISGATGGESDGNTLPESMMQSSEEVVLEALQALKKRKKAIVVPGAPNRALMQMPRFLTRHRLLKVLAVMGDPERAL